MKNIWDLCNGKNYIKPISVNCYRIVEDQAKSSTRRLVTNEIKHDLLEEMIEENKPKISSNTKKLHYLLFTPFRYPPLKFGSRFGSRYEKSIFYGSIELKTAMAEKAFYRMSFIRASHSEQGNMVLNMTSFQSKINTKTGIDLTDSPFFKFKELISSPISYHESQKIGTEMRNNAIESFIYFSARTNDNSKNIGVISPKCFETTHNIEKTLKSWSCFPTKNSVEFSLKFSEQKENYIFTDTDFLYENVFPSIPISH